MFTHADKCLDYRKPLVSSVIPRVFSFSDRAFRSTRNCPEWSDFDPKQLPQVQPLVQRSIELDPCRLPLARSIP